MLSCTIGLSRLLNAQPHWLFSHHTTSACSDSRPGNVSQHTAPVCMRVMAVAEKPDSDRSLTTVWKASSPEARSCAERVAVVDEALAHERHGLEAAVRVLRKPGHGVAVIHAPAVLTREVLAHVSAGERRRGTQAVVARRVQIDMVNADEERILGLPRKPERRHAEDGILIHGGSLETRFPAVNARSADAAASVAFVLTSGASPGSL